MYDLWPIHGSHRFFWIPLTAGRLWAVRQKGLTSRGTAFRKVFGSAWSEEKELQSLDPCGPGGKSETLSCPLAQRLQSILEQNFSMSTNEKPWLAAHPRLFAGIRTHRQGPIGRRGRTSCYISPPIGDCRRWKHKNSCLSNFAFKFD